MNVLVSVIIPLYNRKSTIKRAVDSVLNQTYPFIEVIVVDDCSTDGSGEIVKKYDDNKVNYIRLHVHSGANIARNVGIDYSRGEYIAFQDSDDEWLPEKLSAQLEQMAHENLSVCYCPYLICDNNFCKPCFDDYEDCNKYQMALRETIKKHNVVGTPTIVIKRNLLQKLSKPYFDETMPRLQDYDFALKIIAETEVAYVNTPLVKVYRMNESITNNVDYFTAVERIINKYKDFLDIKEYIKSIIHNDALQYESEIFVKKILELQKYINPTEFDCKKAMLAYMIRKSEYRRELLINKSSYKLKLLCNEKFVIYGAGKYGREFYYRIKNKGLCPKCFLVTQNDREEYIDGIPVLSLSDYNDKDDFVVICIAEKNHLELSNNLIKLNYHHFCCYYPECKF